MVKIQSQEEKIRALWLEYEYVSKWLYDVKIELDSELKEWQRLK